MEDARRSELVLEDAELAEAAFLGRQGALLCAVDANDGKPLAQYKLTPPPVFDGMIAAQGRLFVSLQNGSLVCLGQ